MSESAQHQKLVKQLLQYAENLVGADKTCFITSDAADSYQLPPLTAEGFRPDVYYQYGNLMLIGEAKTSKDVDSLHSKLQYESYLKKCALFPGKAYFVVAVHWTDKAAVHNIISRLKKRIGGTFDFVILEGY